MTTKARLPSPAQARQIANVWASSHQTLSLMTRGPQHSPKPYNDATTLAIVKYGWFSSTGENKSYPNGTTWDIYRLNDSGVDALEHFLWETRHKRKMAA